MISFPPPKPSPIYLPSVNRRILLKPKSNQASPMMKTLLPQCAGGSSESSRSPSQPVTCFSHLGPSTQDLPLHGKACFPPSSFGRSVLTVWRPGQTWVCSTTIGRPSYSPASSCRPPYPPTLPGSCYSIVLPHCRFVFSVMASDLATQDRTVGRASFSHHRALQSPSGLVCNWPFPD